MSDTDKNAILIRALEASGAEREAQLARAILGDPAAPSAAAATPEGLTPGQAYVQQQQQAAAQAAAEQLPEGIMTKAEMDAHEQRAAPKSYREQREQMAEGDRYIKSFQYHAEQR